MIYVDSCYVVKCYLMEPGTPEVRELLADADGVASCVHARHLLKAAPFFGVRGTNVVPIR